MTEPVTPREISMLRDLVNTGFQHVTTDFQNMAASMKNMEATINAALVKGSGRMDDLASRVTLLEQKQTLEEGERRGLVTAAKLFWTLAGGGGVAAIVAIMKGIGAI
jgi:hypothetical protein